MTFIVIPIEAIIPATQIKVMEIASKSIEGFGISYIEAALFGIPSIASNVGGTSEAVIHNKTGVILNDINDLEKNLKELLVDNQKRINMGKEAMKRATSELLWDKITAEYCSLINRVL